MIDSLNYHDIACIAQLPSTYCKLVKYLQIFESELKSAIPACKRKDIDKQNPEEIIVEFCIDEIHIRAGFFSISFEVFVGIQIILPAPLEIDEIDAIDYDWGYTTVDDITYQKLETVSTFLFPSASQQELKSMIDFIHKTVGECKFLLRNMTKNNNDSWNENL